MNEPNKYPNRIFLYVLYVLGVVASLYLYIIVFYSDAGKFCEIFKTDCLSVLNSEYSQLFGISNSTIGLGYFFFNLLVLSLYPGISSRNYFAESLILISVNFFAVCFSIYYIYILKAVLQEACFGCYVIHAINFITLVFNAFALKTGYNNQTFQLIYKSLLNKTSILFLTIVILFISNIIFGLNLIETKVKLSKEKKVISESLNYFLYQYNKSPKYKIKDNIDDVTVGFKNEQLHQIVLIYKEKCKHCKDAKDYLIPLIKKFPNNAYLVLKNFNNFTEPELKKMEISRVPAVLIDGKLALGWNIKGFMKEFIEECEC